MSLSSLAQAAAAGAANAPLPPGALDLLNSLRDIHEPPPPGWWPPAPGWWLLAATLLAALVFGAIVLRARWRRAAPIRAALAELEAWRTRAGTAPLTGEAAAKHADELAILLRRAALTRYPRSQVAPLVGDAFLEFLDASAGADAFRSDAVRALGSARYGPAPTLDPVTAASLAERWLRAHGQSAPATKGDGAAHSLAGEPS